MDIDEDLNLREIIQEEGRIFFECTDLEHIEVNDDPSRDKNWAITEIFNVDQKGDIRMWIIGFDGEYLRSGDGRYDTKNYIYRRRKIVPKANRNMLEQAVLKARSKYKVMYQKGYRPMENINVKEVDPELGQPYKKKDGSIKCPIRSWPVGVQAKLDGMRMRAKLIGDKVVKTSRKHHDLSQMFHIDYELKLLLSELPKGCFIEGELYNHKYARNQLQSFITKWKGGPHPMAHEVNFYIFSVYYDENPPYEERYHLLLNAYRRLLERSITLQKVHVLSMTLAHSIEEIYNYHDYYVEVYGFEGLVVRKLAGTNPKRTFLEESKYRPGRTNSIIKFKNFIDGECIIVDVEQGKGEHEGCAVFVVKSNKGKVFNVTPAATLPERRLWYRNKEKVLGKMYTFRYLSISEYGIPQSPVGVGFRELLDM